MTVVQDAQEGISLGSVKGPHHSKPNGERDEAVGSDEELSHLVIPDGGDDQSEMSLAEVLASGRSGRKPKSAWLACSFVYIHSRL